MKKFLLLLFPLAFIFTPLLAKDSTHPLSIFTDNTVEGKTTLTEKPIFTSKQKNKTISITYGIIQKKEYIVPGLFYVENDENKKESVQTIYIAQDDQYLPSPTLYFDILQQVYLSASLKNITFQDRAISYIQVIEMNDSKITLKWTLFDKDSIHTTDVTLTPDGNGGNYFSLEL